MNRIVPLILAGLLLASSPVAFARADAGETLVADFADHSGLPLLKRMNTFSVSYSFGLGGDSSGFLQAAPTLKGLRSESMRVDLSMGNGGLGKYFAQGTLEDMTHQFTALDVLLSQLYKNGTQPYFSYSFMPYLLQPDGGDFRSAPSDFDAWQRLCRDIAAHYEAQGWPLAAHEIWNEPDLGDTFYNDTWENFIRMYEYAVRGIREANPDATVGGMSLAFAQNVDQEKIRQFLDHVQQNDLPMDFLSYHNYGTIRYLRETPMLNAILAEYGDTFSGLGLHINEFHVSENWTLGDPAPCNTADMACLAVQAIRELVEMPTVTSVNWATWRDGGEGLSMVNNQTGQRSAVYHALKCYNDMPIDRVALQETQYIKGFASVNERAAGVMLFTRAVKDRPVTVRLDNLPFDRVDVKVYAIDAAHSSIYDGSETDRLETIDTLTDVSTEGLTWSGMLAERGILYIRIVPAGEKVVQKAVWSLDDGVPVAGEVATVVRREYYFEDRTSTSFSEFDLGTFTAWAGMGDRAQGLTRGAVLLENLPQRLTVTPTVYGTMAEGATCFLLAEYCDAAGEMVLSRTWMLGDTMTPGQPFALETPEGFAGTLKLTWGMQDAGEDVTLKLHVE